MGHNGHLCVMASEESEDIIPLPDGSKLGKYVLMFDPLGWIIQYRCERQYWNHFFNSSKDHKEKRRWRFRRLFQKGCDQVAAGYFIYGSSTMLVYTTGNGVHGFTLDPSLGEFLFRTKVSPHLRVEKSTASMKGIYIRGTTARAATLTTSRRIERRGHPYTLRYIGSLVADFHRNLLKGGIFLYPGPKGKLRLLYEASPLAMIVEQAGGAATTGSQRILDVQPSTLHQKVPLIIGSREDVAEYARFFEEAQHSAAD